MIYKSFVTFILCLAFSIEVASQEPLNSTPSVPTLPPPINLQKIISNYNSAECCLFIDQLKSVKLAKREKLELMLHKSNYLLNLSTGPTFASLIEVPLSHKKERYVVEAQITKVDDDLYTFFPYVALLNSQLKLIGTSDFTHSDYYGDSFFQPRATLNFSFSIGRNDIAADDAVRYFLIYTRKKHFTNLNIDALQKNPRNIMLKEVSIVYSGASGEYIRRDEMYGIPASRVYVSNHGIFF